MFEETPACEAKMSFASLFENNVKSVFSTLMSSFCQYEHVTLTVLKLSIYFVFFKYKMCRAVWFRDGGAEERTAGRAGG